MRNNRNRTNSSALLALTAVLLAVASPAAYAQLKVGVVNVPELLEESPQAKAAMESLQSEFAPRQRDIVNQQNELKARRERLQREGATMSEAERRRAERELRNGERELGRRQNEYVEDLNVRRNEELVRLQKTVLQEVQNYARTQGYDLVIGDGVLYSKGAIDITASVLGVLQARAKASAAPPSKQP